MNVSIREEHKWKGLLRHGGAKTIILVFNPLVSDGSNEYKINHDAKSWDDKITKWTTLIKCGPHRARLLTQLLVRENFPFKMGFFTSYIDLGLQVGVSSRMIKHDCKVSCA